MVGTTSLSIPTAQIFPARSGVTFFQLAFEFNVLCFSLTSPPTHSTLTLCRVLGCEACCCC